MQVLTKPGASRTSINFSPWLQNKIPAGVVPWTRQWYLCLVQTWRHLHTVLDFIQFLPTKYGHAIIYITQKQNKGFYLEDKSISFNAPVTTMKLIKSFSVRNLFLDGESSCLPQSTTVKWHQQHCVNSNIFRTRVSFCQVPHALASILFRVSSAEPWYDTTEANQVSS